MLVRAAPQLERKGDGTKIGGFRVTSATNGGGGQQHAPRPRRQWRHFIGELFKMDTPAGGGAASSSAPGQSGGDGTTAPATEQTSGLVRNIRLAFPHVLIFSCTVLYSLVGAAVFQRLERPFELDHLQKHSLAIAQAQNALLNLADGDTNATESGNLNATVNAAIDELIRVTMEAFEEGIRADELLPIPRQLFEANDADPSDFDPDILAPITSLHRPKWNFHSSLFFTATLLTSIGYGNLVPISPLGRLFCILYALLGIPLTLVTIADVAKFFGDMILSSGKWLERHLFGGTAQRASDAEGQKRSDEGEQLLQQSGPYTKAFVLGLLFLYMVTMAVLFSHLQPGWDLVDSMYFTLITLVTIGFGDFCPPANTASGAGQPVDEDYGSEGHYGGWILFIFVGLTLSTLTVDMVGSSYIDRIHTLGRGFHLGSFLTMLKLGRGECGPDSARLLRQLHAGAYIPADVKLIPYIDALIHSRSSADTLVLLNGGHHQQHKVSETGDRPPPSSPPPPPPPPPRTAKE